MGVRRGPRPGVRLGVLGGESSPYVSRLLCAAEQHDSVSHAERFSFAELQAACHQLDSRVQQLSDLDVLLVRTMPLGSLEQVIFRMDCLHLLNERNVQVINSPRSLEIAIDKWLTLHRLQQAGVPVPHTVACQNRDQALEAFETLGGDVVVKPLFGGEGRGLLHVNDRDLAWRVFSTLQQLGSVFYLQEFLHHGGFDIRVLFVGDSYFAMKRQVDEGWRTNVSQGSQALPHCLSQVELDLARQAFGAVGAEVAGVDLLPCMDGSLRVLEVNAVPGWLALQKVCNEDISKRVIDYAVQKCSSC